MRQRPNVWRQWRAQRVHCTPGLGRSRGIAAVVMGSYEQNPFAGFRSACPLCEAVVVEHEIVGWVTAEAPVDSVPSKKSDVKGRLAEDENGLVALLMPKVGAAIRTPRDLKEI